MKSYQPVLNLKNERTKHLPKQDQIDLVMACKAGSRKAQDKLVETNARFILQMALSNRGRGIDVEDLVQEGSWGLIKAAERFNPAMNLGFLTYAVWWIRQGMMKAIYEHGNTIRIPINHFQKSKHRNLKVEKSKNEARVKMLYRLTNPIRLDAPTEIGEFNLPDTNPPPDQNPENEDRKVQLKALVETLPERLQEIILRRFGLDGQEPETLEEIAQRFELSRERVRQLERDAMKKLKLRAKNIELKERLL